MVPFSGIDFGAVFRRRKCDFGGAMGRLLGVSMGCLLGPFLMPFLCTHHLGTGGISCVLQARVGWQCFNHAEQLALAHGRTVLRVILTRHQTRLCAAISDVILWYRKTGSVCCRFCISMLDSRKPHYIQYVIYTLFCWRSLACLRTPSRSGVLLFEHSGVM